MNARPTGGLSLAAMALSPDGRRLFLAHAAEVEDASELLTTPGPLVLTAWDLERGGRVGRCTTGPYASPALVALGGGLRVLVAHRDGGTVLDFESGSTHPIQHASDDALYGPPGVDARGTVAVVRCLRSGGVGHGVALLSLETGAARVLDDGETGASSVSANGRWVAYVVNVPGEGERVRIRDSADGRVCAESPVFETQLWGARRLLVDDAGQLVAWTGDEGIHLWRPGQSDTTDVETGRLGTAALAFGAVGGEAKLRVLSDDLVLSQCISIDVASGGEDSSEYLDGVRAFALSLDGRRGAVGTATGIQVLELPGSSAAASPAGPQGATRMVVQGDTRTVAFLDGPAVVVTGSRASGVLCAWAADGKPGLTLETGAAGIQALHACPDGETLVFVGTDGALGTCRPREGAVKRWPTPFIYASELAIEPDGQRAYCVHGLVNGMRGKNHGRNLPRAEQDVSTVWNIADGALVSTLETPPRLVQSAAWLPDGSGQLCARHGTAWYLLALPSGACLDSDSFPYDWDKDGPSPQVLPGGNALLTLQGGKLVVWDVAARRRRATLCGAVHTKVLAVDARGEHCVYRTAEGRAFLARLSDGEVVQQLEGSTGGEAISFAAFGASGRTLALVLEGQAVCTVAI